MQNTYSTPQIFLFGRIVSGNGFPANELFVKYKFIYGTDFTLINGDDSGNSYIVHAFPDEEEIAVYFDQPLSLNLSCKSLSGWPKLFVEVWQVDDDGKQSLAGYGTGYIPVKPGYSKFAISCWRPTESLGVNLGEKLLKNIPEFKKKSVVTSTVPKFSLMTFSSGQIIVEVETIFKDFILHGIQFDNNNNFI